MSIYHRYFRITSGPLMDKANELEAAKESARTTVLAFCNEIGAKNALSRNDGSWVGFTFANTPDQAVWKQPNSFGAYWPRKNTAAGRELLARIEALPRPKHIDNALEAVGLHAGVPVLNDAGRGYCAALSGSPALGLLFVGVPWRDVDPERLSSYKRENEAGIYFSMELEHLSWMPTAEMVEIKRWEVEKEIEALNAQLRAAAKMGSEVAA